MATIPLQQAIEMYARASRSWFGRDAALKTAAKVREATERGDAEGVEVWSRVLDEIRKLDAASSEGGAAS